MKAIAFVLLAAGLSFAADDKKPVDLDPGLKADLALAQRDYYILKAQKDAETEAVKTAKSQELENHPVTAKLNEVGKRAIDACQKIGKVMNFDIDQCVEAPKTQASNKTPDAKK